MTASSCQPSDLSIVTGSYQKDFGPAPTDQSILHGWPENTVRTIPKVIRALEGSNAVPDPFDDPATASPALAPSGFHDVIGGYCAMAFGKEKYDPEKAGFNAAAAFRDGRLTCADGSGTPPAPECFTGFSTVPVASQLVASPMYELLAFIDQMIYVDTVSHMPRVQPFFALFYPTQQPRDYHPGSHNLGNMGAVALKYLFGTGGGGQFGLDNYSGLSVSTAFQEADEKEFYASVLLVDDQMREIRKLLHNEDLNPRICATSTMCVSPSVAIEPQYSLEKNTVIIYITDNGYMLPHGRSLRRKWIPDPVRRLSTGRRGSSSVPGRPRWVATTRASSLPTRTRSVARSAPRCRLRPSGESS